MALSFGRVKNYGEWIRPRIVCNALKILEKELLKYHPEEVHLSLTTDPFMYDHRKGELITEVKNLTLSIIELLNSRGIRVVTLTKGYYPEELMDTRFKRINLFGISIVSLNPGFKKKFEPFSAPYELRIRSLWKLHRYGYNTWVNIEPYPVPEIDPTSVNIENLLNRLKFVDKIRIARWNYNSFVKKRSKDFYKLIAEKAWKFCETSKIECEIDL